MEVVEITSVWPSGGFGHSRPAGMGVAESTLWPLEVVRPPP
jgi:hypothetical protein